jgi:Putative Ig domain
MKNATLLLALSVCGLCTLIACGGGEIAKSTFAPPVSALAITSSSPPVGDVQAPYGTGGNGFSLTASGGKSPYAWNWASSVGSSLPTGLNVVNGSIVGTPTTAGDYEVIVTVTDAESPALQTSATYTIAIDASAENYTTRNLNRVERNCELHGKRSSHGSTL